MTDPKSLNPEQLQASTHKKGPLLIIAGAGTGKTTVITERIKHLILNEKVHPSQILALTFTEKAAREMEERVDIAMPYGFTQMWISTYHAFCDRILRSEAIHIGLDPTYRLLTQAQTILFLRKNLFKFELAYFRPLGNPYKFLDGMLQHFSRLKDEDISPKDYQKYAKKLKESDQITSDEIQKTKELAQAFATYEELKAKEGIMDFSDLISNTLKLFRTRENILKQYQNQFKHILVDEFQDTNFAQNQLAILLAGKEQNIAVVADDDQSIYRFRGSSISNIMQFKDYFPNAKVVSLIKNYRSTSEILQKAYIVIQNNNPDRLEVKEKINKKLISERRVKGARIEFIFEDRVENEAESVVKKIQEIVQKDKIRYKDIAILVRANDHSQPFIRSLQRQNIPYQFLGPGQLFHQEEIKDLIAYLKVLYNFGDSASLYRVLNNELFKFNTRDIAVLLNFARRKNISLFEALETIAAPYEQTTEIFLKPDTLEKIKTLVQMVHTHLKRVPKDTAGQILYYYAKDTGLLQNLLDAKTEAQVKVSQNISRFFEKLKTFEAENKDASIFAIVDWIDLSMQMGESPLATDTDWTENNAVNILTIHSSKGLEFPVVFLVNLVTQRFPTRERHEQIPIPQDLIKEILPEGDYHLQEERRLFYVGMTRARDYLFLTAAHFYGEGKRERKFSPFLIEALGEDYIEKKLADYKLKQQIFQPSLLDWIEQYDSSNTAALQTNDLSSQLSINYLSYSQLQTFDICPLHYKLKYIVRVPGAPSPAQSFGTSIHGALRDFYQKVIQKEPVDPKEITAFLEQNWLTDGYTSKEHEKAAFGRAKEVLERYLEQNFKEHLTPADRPIAVEIPFQFFLKNETRSLKLAGRIDRVDNLPDGKIEIIDYKTGSNMPDDTKLIKDVQLTFYALGAVNIKDSVFNKTPEEVVLSLYYLEEDRKLTTARTVEQLDAAKDLIFQKVEEIEKSGFECSGSQLCRNCEYKMLCNA